jgi:outer membrane protein insertion porin family
MFQLIKNSCLFLFIFSFFTFAHGEIINKIEINGNKRISNETIKMFSDVQLNDNVDINEIDIILKKIYKSNFFDNVSVIFDNQILSINVIENPIIENINYKGLKVKEILEYN